MTTKSRSSPFLALTSAALSLPAFTATQPVETEISLMASSYKEGDVPAHKVLLGSEERYEIDIYQFYLLTPLGRNWSFSFNTSREIMSGASPRGTVEGLDGKPALIMSGATIRDSRTEVSATTSRYFQNGSVGVGLSHSEEDDYEADAIVLSGEWDFSQKLSTLAVGMSYSSDVIEPTDALLFDRVQKEDKRSRSFTVGWTQVLNKSSVLQSGISVTKHDGYLTDPYKLRDVRPDERLEWAVSLRYRKYLQNVGGAWHLDYRYYSDDFGVDSHTLETAWYQNLGSRFQLVPSVRYYSQREADFYLPFDDFALPLTVDQSSDYRLSAYGAYTFGLKGVVNHNDWAVTISVDRYISREKYGLWNAEFEHPALLNFTLASIGFNIKI
jgi:hypothetical protein